MRFQRNQFQRFFVHATKFHMFSMNIIVFDGLPTGEKRFICSCNQSKMLFVDAQLTYIQFSSLEAFFEEIIQNMFFDDRFSKENWAMVLYQVISIFIDSRSLTKNSEGYPLMKMVHLAFWLLELVSVDFSSTISNSMDFLSKKTNFLAKHLFDNGPPGISVSEVVLLLVSRLTKTVSMDPTSMEHSFTNFPSIEFNSVDFNSIQLVSMGFFPF